MNKHPGEGILYLRQSEVEALCQELDSVAIVRQALEKHALGQTSLPNEVSLSWSNAHNELARSLNIPAYPGHPFTMAGTKIINGYQKNTRHESPEAETYIATLLFDTTTVQPRCIMEGTCLSRLCTASVTALSAEILKGPEISCVAIIGTGVLARTHIELLLKRFPTIRYLQAFDHDEKQIEEFYKEIEEILWPRNILFQATPDVKTAVAFSQLVVSLTPTTDLIRYNWLDPGTIIVNASLDGILPEVVLKASKVIVDDWKRVKNDVHHLFGRMYLEGQIFDPGETAPADNLQHKRPINAEIGEIITGQKSGRDDPADVILVNPSGLVIEDIALATHVYQLALQQGRGQLFCH